MEGHLSVIAKSVLESFNWNFDGKLADGFVDFNMTEILEYLIRNESDVAFYPISLDYMEFESIGYSHITKDLAYVIVSSSGSATYESSDFAFVHIYSSWVWLAWVLSFVILAVFWSMADSNQSKHSTKHRASYEKKNGLTRQMLNTYRVSLNQSANQRLAIGCWIIGCFVINAGFTGGLLSKMTLPPKVTYIETYEDILKHPNMRVILLKDSGIEKSLKGSTDHLRRQIYQQILRYDTAVDVRNFYMDEFFEKMVKGEAILIYDVQAIQEFFPSLISCDDLKMLHVSSENVYKAQYALPMKKNLDARKARIVKRSLQSLFEGDIIARSSRLECWKNREFIPDRSHSSKETQLVVYQGRLLRTSSGVSHLYHGTLFRNQVSYREQNRNESKREKHLLKASNRNCKPFHHQCFVN